MFNQLTNFFTNNSGITDGLDKSLQVDFDKLCNNRKDDIQSEIICNKNELHINKSTQEDLSCTSIYEDTLDFSSEIEANIEYQQRKYFVSLVPTDIETKIIHYPSNKQESKSEMKQIIFPLKCELPYVGQSDARIFVKDGICSTQQKPYISITASMNDLCKPSESTSLPSLPSLHPESSTALFDEFVQIHIVETKSGNTEVKFHVINLTNKIQEVFEELQKLEADLTKRSSIQEKVFNADFLVKEENARLKLFKNELEKNIEEIDNLNSKHIIELEREETLLLHYNRDLLCLLANNIKMESEYLYKIKELKTKLNQKAGTSKEHAEQMQAKIKDRLYVNETAKQIHDIIMDGLYSICDELENRIRDDQTVFGGSLKKFLSAQIMAQTCEIIATIKKIDIPVSDFKGRVRHNT